MGNIQSARPCCRRQTPATTPETTWPPAHPRQMNGTSPLPEVPRIQLKGMTQRVAIAGAEIESLTQARHIRVSAPWLSAVRRGDLDAVERLLPSVDINGARDELGNNALILAAGMAATHTDSFEIVDSEPDGPSDTTGRFMEVFERLLQNPRVDVNAQNLLGATALMEAAASGHLETTRRLLEVPGVDVRITNHQELTAAAIAMHNRHPEVVEALVRFDAAG